MKKPSRKTLINQCWAVCREIVFIRDGGKCVKCGKPVKGHGAHTSHAMPKGRVGALRFDLQNLDLMCYFCHIEWWHKNPIEAGAWFRETFPDRWEYLQQHKNDYKKWTIPDLQELKIGLEKILTEMKAR